MRKFALHTVAFLVALAFLSGCGGNKAIIGPDSQAGRYRVTIQWPDRGARGRLIPRETNSVKVDLSNTAGFTESRTVDRPAEGGFSTIEFTDLPRGSLRVVVTAYPQAGAQGTPLATADIIVTIVANQTTSSTIDMESTIAQVVISGMQSVDTDGTLELAATAKDAAGNVVLVGVGGFAWISETPTIASVDGTGKVTALRVGTATIKAIERESGKFGHYTVTVNPITGGLSITLANPAIGVAVAPTTTSLAPGGTQQFAATVTDSANQFVTWQVQEAEGGSITPGGLYTAPATGGTYHVIATSVADPTKSVTAEVTVSSGRIAFVSYQDSKYRIYVMNASGSDQTPLTTDDGDGNSPSWSPDGSKIAFSSTRDSNHEIYVINADGSGLTRLTTDGTSDLTPTWSPDGSRIAFASLRSGKSQIYVMNADGSEQTRLTNNTYEDRTPVWSPDGSKIAFQSNRDDNKDIYVMDANGTNERRLTNDATMDETPAWSPDGSKIAFASNRDGNWEIYVMNADGSGQTRLTTNTSEDKQPAWSPDGSRIALVSFRDGNKEIYVMNADGSNQVRLTNNTVVDDSPAWMP